MAPLDAMIVAFGVARDAKDDIGDKGTWNSLGKYAVLSTHYRIRRPVLPIPTCDPRLGGPG
jgi:hypothetical protein